MKREHHAETVTETAAVVFTVAELWCAQACVRHEVQNMEQWSYPPANRQLNDQIAEALLLCHEDGATEAALVLTYGDLLVLDYVIKQDMRSAEGRPLGKTILLKTYAARAAIKRGYTLPLVDAPTEPSAKEVRERLAALEVQDEHDDDNPNNNADDHAAG